MKKARKRGRRSFTSKVFFSAPVAAQDPNLEKNPQVVDSRSRRVSLIESFHWLSMSGLSTDQELYYKDNIGSDNLLALHGTFY